MTGRRLATILFAATVVVAAGTFYHFGSATPVAHAKNSPASHSRSADRSAQPVSLPMFFEANQGQTDQRVKFLSRGRGYGLFLTSDEAVLKLQRATASHQPSASSVIRMRLAGANSAARVSGAELLSGKSNYFIGNDPAKWHRGIPQYGRVNYESVYPGIDLTYYGHQGQLEYDFRLAPNADPSQIALTFDGATARLDHGDLVLSTNNGNGEVRFQAPTIYQVDGHAKKTVTGSFRQLADNKVGFQVGTYDHSRELVIDPSLSYFTYLGGSGSESNVKVGIDNASNIYLAGTTTSLDFPGANNAFQGGASDVFVAKLNPSIPPPVSELIYATYIGGSLEDDLAGLAVDGGGLVYLAGTTTSADFPIEGNAFQAAPLSPGTHGFVTKLDGNGTPTYSTYLSGTNGGAATLDLVTGLAIDTKGDAFVTGTTTSTNKDENFPATPNGYQNAPFPGVITEFFASKINTLAIAPASSMLYSTYFGGSFPTAPQLTGGGIAVDNGGNMYITGATNFIFDSAAPPPPAARTNFPILNAQQGCLDLPPNTTPCDPNLTSLDAFVAKINPNRVGEAGLVYSTYLGGSSDDTGLAITVDSASNAYVTGQTLSANWTPPTSPTPFQSAFGGGVNKFDAFIAKIGNPSQTTTTYPLTYFTYLGGSGDDVGEAIAVDAVGAVHVTGSTNSLNDFPLFDALFDQSAFGGATDAFVATILTGSSGQALGDSVSFLGGSAEDHGQGIVVDTNSTSYVSGITRSTNFPRPAAPPAPLPFQKDLNPAANQDDAFLVRIGQTSTFIEDPANPPTASPNPASLGNSVTFTFTFINQGKDPAANVFFSATYPSVGVLGISATTSPGGTCPIPSGGTVLCKVGSVPVNSKVTATVVLTPTAGTTSLDVLPFLSFNGGGAVSFAAVDPVPVTDFSISVAPPSVTITAGDSTSFVATLSPHPTTYASAITMSDSGLPTASTGTFTSTTVNLGTSAATTTLNISTTPRPASSTSLFGGRAIYATWLPIGGLSLLGLGVGAGARRRRWLAGMLLGLIAGLILLQPACGGSSSSTTSSGGTPAGTYTIVITGSSGSASHNQRVTLIVN